MQPHLFHTRRLARASGLLACAAVAVTLSLTAAGKRRVTKLSYDPSAPSVELFEGIDKGTLEVTVIPKDALSANVFIENKTDKPLSVKLPKAVATVQVLKQGFGGGGFGGMGGGIGGMGGGIGGGAQAGGGGFGGGGFGGGMGGIGGGLAGGFGNTPGIAGGAANNAGFFSIPSDKIVQIPLTTVCLEHGKPDPTSAMRYKLIPVETYTSNPMLQELLVMVGTGALESGAAQAAAWNIANDMSWDKLAAKNYEQLSGAPGAPYFSREQLAVAQHIVSQASAQVREKAEKQEKEGKGKRRAE